MIVPCLNTNPRSAALWSSGRSHRGQISGYTKRPTLGAILPAVARFEGRPPLRLRRPHLERHAPHDVSSLVDTHSGEVQFQAQAGRDRIDPVGCVEIEAINRSNIVESTLHDGLLASRLDPHPGRIPHVPPSQSSDCHGKSLKATALLSHLQPRSVSSSFRAGARSSDA